MRSLPRIIKLTYTASNDFRFRIVQFLRNTKIYKFRKTSHEPLVSYQIQIKKNSELSSLHGKLATASEFSRFGPLLRASWSSESPFVFSLDCVARRRGPNLENSGAVEASWCRLESCEFFWKRKNARHASAIGGARAEFRKHTFTKLYDFFVFFTRTCVSEF